MTQQSPSSGSEPDPDRVVDLCNQTDGVVSVERGPEETLNVTIDDTTYRLSKEDGDTLKKEVRCTIDLIEADFSTEPVLQLTRKRGVYNTNNPFHITGEYGCHNSKTVSGDVVDMNLVERTWEPTYTGGPRGYWSIGERDTRMSFDEYIEKFICGRCERTVRFWHTQRQIFLPRLADQLDVEEIDSDTFTTQEKAECACDICGTARSGISELEVQKAVFGVNGPFLLCPTCRGLLIEAESQPIVSRKSLSDHPRNHGSENIVKKPIEDPNFDPNAVQTKKDRDSPSLDHLRELQQETFVEIVKQFDGVTKGVAERLYNNGFNSVPGLRKATKNELKDITFIGSVTADSIKKGADIYLKRYRSEFRNKNEKPDQSDILRIA